MREKVALICRNSNGFVEKLLEIWEKNNIAVLIDSLSTVENIKKIICMENITKAYIDSKYSSVILSLTALHIYIERIDIESSSCDQLEEKIYMRFRCNYTDDPAVVFFSSGTTDNAKGVILSHNAINKTADKIKKYMQVDENKTIGIIKSLVHSSTLVGELLVALKSNMKVFFINSVSPSIILKHIQKQKINIICLNPTLLQILYELQERKKYIFTELEEIYVSGDIISVRQICNAENAFKIPIYNVYGATECGPRLSAQHKGSDNIKGSVGCPLEGVEIFIEKSRNGEYGGIWVKTECFMDGYLDKNIIIPMKNGFWNTGDYGYMREGQLFVLGRYKNIIISAGHNISPEKIEHMIAQTGIVREVAILGIPDSVFGEKVICIYSDKNEKDADLYTFCLKNLTAYERPQKFIYIKEGLKKNNNGKIDRKYYIKRIVNEDWI